MECSILLKFDFFLLLFFFFSSLTKLYASEVFVERQSPERICIENHSTASASFLITNRSHEKKSFQGEIRLPPGWTLIPGKFPSITLEPGESYLQLVVIKPSKSALSGIYHLEYLVNGETSQDFQIEVKKTRELEVCIEGVPKHAFFGEKYFITLVLKNKGNSKIPLFISAKEYLGYALSFDQNPYILLEPGEIRCVKVEVHTFLGIKCHKEHIVTFHVKECHTQEVLFAHTTLVNMYPLGYSKEDIYHYYRSHVELGAGTHGGRKEVYVGSSGCGYLDENREKHVDYYFRAPFIQQADIAYDLTCTQEDAFVRYVDPIQNLYAGNGIYTMSPLTMSYRYGWGAGYATYFDPVEVGTMYVKDQSHYKIQNGAYYVAYTPLKWCRFSLNVLNSNLNKEASFQLGEPRNALTYSTRAQAAFCREFVLDGEYACSKGKDTVDRVRHATFINVSGEPFKSYWYAFQNIYANPFFVGFYSDTKQTSASIGFPIYGKVHMNLSQNLYDYNLHLNPDKGRAPRESYRWATLSSPLPWDMFASLSYNNTVIKDLLIDVDYRTNYVSLVANKSYCKWLFQAVCEGGEYVNKKVFNQDHSWQNYQLYVHYKRTPYETYSIYSRQGYQMLVDDLKWAQIYGINLILCGYNNWFYNILYEHTLRIRDFNRNFVTAEVKRVFDNEHSLRLKGFWNRESFIRYYESSLGNIELPKERTTEVEFLLTYTMPIDIPVSVKKSIGSIEGAVFARGGYPLIKKRVLCNQLRAMTNQAGKYQFSHLVPGLYYITLEQEADGLVSLQPLPLLVSVQEGCSTPVNIEMVRESKIRGKICYSNEEKELINVSGAFVSLVSRATEERMQTTSNAHGEFFFNHLRPGDWEVVVNSCNLPEEYTLLTKEILVMLKPGEEQKLTFKAVRQERKIKLIDQGALK